LSAKPSKTFKTEFFPRLVQRGVPDSPRQARADWAIPPPASQKKADHFKPMPNTRSKYAHDV